MKRKKISRLLALVLCGVLTAESAFIVPAEEQDNADLYIADQIIEDDFADEEYENEENLETSAEENEYIVSTEDEVISDIETLDSEETEVYVNTDADGIIEDMVIEETISEEELLTGAEDVTDYGTFIDGGDCGNDGDNVKWAIYDNNQDTIGDVLVISGNGAMVDYTGDAYTYDYYYTSAPWGGYMQNYKMQLVLEKGVSHIGSYAFYCCSKLIGNLIIPDSIKSIGNNAFQYCNGLSGYLQISDNMTYIGARAFEGCSGLTGDLKIPEGLTNIEINTFHDCSGLTGNLVIPKGIQSIGEGAFSNCRNLTGNLVIPDSVTVIGARAFYNCRNLTGNLVIPDGVTSIEKEAFSGCRNLTGNLVLPESISEIKAAAFWNCSGLTGSLIIPSGVERIEEAAFGKCSNFWGRMDLPESVSYIGGGAFADCVNIMEVHVLNSQCEIENVTFEYGEELDSDCAFSDLMTICGYENSTAQAYAEKNNLSFKVIFNDTVFNNTVEVNLAEKKDISFRLEQLKSIAWKSSDVSIVSCGTPTRTALNGVYEYCCPITGNKSGSCRVEAYDISDKTVYATFDVFVSDYNLSGCVGTYLEFQITSSVYQGYDFTCEDEEALIDPELQGYSSVTINNYSRYTYRYKIYANKAFCGKLTYTGVSDGIEGNVTVRINDHKWNSEYTIDKEPTNTEAGIKSIHCSVCDTVKEGSEEEIPVVLPELQLQTGSVTSLSTLLSQRVNLGIELVFPDSVEVSDITCEETESGYLYSYSVFLLKEGNNILKVYNKDTDEVYNVYILSISTPRFEKEVCTGERFDLYFQSFCGEGIDTIGYDHSVIHDYEYEIISREYKGKVKYSYHISISIDTVGNHTMYVTNNNNELMYQGDITVTEHIPGEWKTGQTANCTNTGWKYLECAKCKGVMDTETIPIDSSVHIWNEQPTVDEQATCITVGNQSIHCSLCDAVKEGSSEVIPVKDHSWDEGTITTEATCTEKGEKTYTCTICKTTRTEEIAAKGHKWNGHVTVDQEATCTETGSQSIHCSVCGAIKEGSIEEIPMAEHNWDNGRITRAATCIKKGEKTFTCTVCNETKVESTPFGAHKFDAWKTVSEATVFKAKVQQHKCTVCGFTETRSVGSALRPTITVNVPKIFLKTRQSTTAFKVTGLAAGNKISSWKTSNKNIFTVTSSGKLTAGKKTGTATLIITLKSGLQKKIPVVVQKDAVRTSRITGLSKDLTIEKGGSYKLKPVIRPITSEEKITYTSSDKKVATVSSKGTIKAKKAGTAKITVQSGKKKFTVTVTVPKTETVKITGVKKTLSLTKGKSYTIKAKVYPADSDEEITYKSSNKKVATVDKNGKVKGIKKGAATIYVKSGKVTVKCKVTVK